eukprot:CAMPEP_0114650890 /NCGR_PEP_ID=MMETSP0191-20121206/7963_1 /TAXON_ID=126664 /ORGANISM="Sorites sp." /LENGTH=615 /DNA_ID=CAMNT_0001864891 /DNA_START=89 /DNA_END=1936 /DNA_ORIENTATION=+
MRRCLEGRPKERSRSPPSTWREGVIVQSSGTRTSESRSAREPELHILYASPLDHRIPQINIQGEVDLLQDSLKEANCRMKISVGAATTKSFAQLLTLAETAGSIILHLSVHVVNAESNVGVVFENDFGGAHILYRPQLEELLGNGEQLHGLSFVFINGCSSESIAEILVEAGCHLVIATRGKVYDSAATVFTQQFYYALGSQVSVRSAFERAQQVLRVDPNPQVKASADMFVLFGQHAARSQTLPRRPTQVHESADGQSGLRSELWDLGAPGCLPPRVEDYIDRSSVLREVLRNLEWSSGKQARRACILYGPEGIGKSVAAIELAYFASSPGRLFSRKVLFVTIEGKPDLANVLQGISLALARRRLLTSASRNQKDVLQALQQMDKTRSRYLLVLDDHSGAVHGSPQVRSLLSNIMETVRNLSLVVCSREHVYESLGPCKCVNVPLGPLTDAQSAELFLKRSHRPLHPSDLEPGARSQQNLTQNEEFLKNLAGHPLLRRMGGNPGQVNAMCQRVTPELKSLWDLCTWLPMSWLPGSMATTTTRVRSMSFESENLQSGLRRMSEMPDSSMQLTRKMSIDGVHTEPMVRMMSMDGPPLARMMSVDETQATENGIDHS